MTERTPRTPDRIREIARYVLGKLSRGQEVPRLGEAPMAPREMIDFLIDEDPSLTQIVDGTPLMHIRKEVEKEEKRRRVR